VSGASLKQIGKFKYLGALFTIDGRQDEELNSGQPNGLQYSIVMKRELS